MADKNRDLPTCAEAHHDCDFRDVLGRIGDKWSLLVILMLEKMPDRRARFSDLKRTIPGISQRMLTATLRNLERDGMLTRHVYPEVPPRVEYQLTPLGRELMQPVCGLVAWLEAKWPEIRGAREKFDARQRTRARRAAGVVQADAARDGRGLARYPPPQAERGKA